jgi:hypothetical protein
MCVCGGGANTSLAWYICVLVPLYVCPHSSIYVSSCLGICVLILCLLVYRGICVLVPLCVCPHSSIYVCSLPHLYKHAGDPQDGPLGVLCGRHVCSRYEETFFIFYFYFYFLFFVQGASSMRAHLWSYTDAFAP